MRPIGSWRRYTAIPTQMAISPIRSEIVSRKAPRRPGWARQRTVEGVEHGAHPGDGGALPQIAGGDERRPGDREQQAHDRDHRRRRPDLVEADGEGLQDGSHLLSCFEVEHVRVGAGPHGFSGVNPGSTGKVPHGPPLIDGRYNDRAHRPPQPDHHKDVRL